MKTRSILLVFALFVLPLSFGQKEEETKKINWITLEEAGKLSVESPKKKGILIDVYTPWCGPCKMMNKSTFGDASVIDYVNENFYAVKFNGEGPDSFEFNGQTFANPGYDNSRSEKSRNSMHEFTQALGVTGYPTLAFFTSDLEPNVKSVGYKTPEQLLEILKAIE